jgi:hypothetical protein
MTDFTQNIADWQTFYLLAGTAAATLIGLLFVAVSIHIDIFHRKAYSDLHHFAALTFNCFFYVLLIAILFLIPNQSAWGLGIPLLLLGGLGLVNALIQQRRARHILSSRQGASLASRFNLPILCLAGLSLLALGIILQLPISLYGLVLVIVFLLASASQNAWALLVQTEDLELAKLAKRK